MELDLALGDQGKEATVGRREFHQNLKIGRY